MMWNNYQKDRDCEERYQYFVKEDFKDAYVFDVGANEGIMLDKAKEWGAKKVLGVDDTNPNNREDIVVQDFNKFRMLTSYDIALVLSVIRFVKNKRKFLERIATQTKIIYFEGHQQEYIKDTFNLIKPNDFKWEKLGETPVARPFYRGVRKF